MKARLLAILVALLGGAAQTAAGSIEPLPGHRWCLSSATVKGCDRGRGFATPRQRAAISPDGRSIYLPGGQEPTVGILRRDPSDGSLRQAPGPAGCVGARAGTCAKVSGFAGPAHDVIVSPDGHFVYVATGEEDGDRTSIIVFARGSDGRLARRSCVASAALADCAVQPGLTAYALSITPDGAHVYAGGGTTLSARDGTTLSTFARDATSGALTAAGCRSTRGVAGCEATTVALDVPVWSRDGRLGLAVSRATDRVVAFTRDPATGTLTQSACVSAKHLDGCAYEPRFERAAHIFSIAIAPDDGTVYIAAGPQSFVFPPGRGVPFALVAFRSQPATGALVARPGGCRHTRRVRGCRQDRRVVNLGALVFSPNGRRLFAGSDDRIVEFTRDQRSARLRRSATLRVCDAPGPCAAGRPPIGGENGLLVSPDGRSLYGFGESDFYAKNGTISALAVR